MYGCAGVSHLWDESDQIYGTWHFEDQSLGPLRLIFTKDHQFEVDANGDGQKDIWGRFELFENRIKFIDDKPRIITDCYEPGYKTYTIEEGLLVFKEFADQCKPRKFILSHPMKRFGD